MNAKTREAMVQRLKHLEEMELALETELRNTRKLLAKSDVHEARKMLATFWPPATTH